MGFKVVTWLAIQLILVKPLQRLKESYLSEEIVEVIKP